ncbi:hypothetical protein Q9295_15250 [Xinfangfangia sp. CPCC 101601]|uniref:Uncharacterized protein n=1 Tax=Pseudogemmobacter lacusdianii TaxID=3069608 RepID=A0ABU0W141_9RHOB|nr:hypothetical protein [Xinfangfangia sp. CPCC 101601]MDQ2067732.1 hypothetical protein [Xinfangfangia sp. CPCC 101601]
MLWDIRALMKPALSVIDMIPNVHRTAALTALRRAVIDGRPTTLKLSRDERDLAFYEAKVVLTSPIGARILLALYQGGHLKLKKPPQKVLPALNAYIATEPAFRAEVARIIAADEAARDRLAEIIADPSVAREDELTPRLIDRVIAARLGHGYFGTMEIAGRLCHRERINAVAQDGLRGEDAVICWWIDGAGQRQGEGA